MTKRNPTAIALLGLAAVLTISVAAAAANATWHAFGHFPEIQPAVDAAAFSQAAPPTDLGPIRVLAPFGISSPTQGPMKQTSANLVLRGVILAVPASRSMAIISDAGNAPISVSVGESLPGGAILDGVAADHVVLLLSGAREILSFPETQSAAGIAAIRANIPGANADRSAAAASSPQEVIETYRQKIADNPQKVLEEFSVSATSQGYRVGEAIAPSVRRAGLVPGDLIVRVNGVPVGDVERDRKHFDDVAASGRARIEVMRGDRLLILSFPLR